MIYGTYCIIIILCKYIAFILLFENDISYISSSKLCITYSMQSMCKAQWYTEQWYTEVIYSDFWTMKNSTMAQLLSSSSLKGYTFLMLSGNLAFYRCLFLHTIVQCMEIFPTSKLQSRSNNSKFFTTNNAYWHFCS